MAAINNNNNNNNTTTIIADKPFIVKTIPSTISTSTSTSTIESPILLWPILCKPRQNHSIDHSIDHSISNMPSSLPSPPITTNMSVDTHHSTPLIRDEDITSNLSDSLTISYMNDIHLTPSSPPTIDNNLHTLNTTKNTDTDTDTPLLFTPTINNVPSNAPIQGRRNIRPIYKESTTARMIRRNITKKNKDIEHRIKSSYDTDQMLIINWGHNDDESPIYIPQFLGVHLKPHQMSGIRFLWRSVMMQPINGCVLAHCMGLGKSLQVITLIYTYMQCLSMMSDQVPKELCDGRVVIVCPPTVMNNWIKEFSQWIPSDQRSILRGLYTIGESSMRLVKLNSIDHWFRNGGVMLVSYQFYRDFVMNTEQSMVSRAFLDPGPSIIIADEGHTIKNPRTMISNVFQQVITKARICLTGSPLQNGLEEYWCMVDWVCPNYLGQLEDFRNQYINPINNGLFHDSTPADTKILTNKLIRKDAGTLRRELPPLYEFVISSKLSSLQYAAYCAFLLEKNKTGAVLFQQYQALLRICNHPFIAQTVRDQLIVKRIEHAKLNSNTSPSSNTPLIMEEEEEEDLGANIISAFRTSSSEQDFGLGDHWMKTTIDMQPDIHSIRHSNKMLILMSIVVSCRSVRDKVLIFSRSIPTLDYIGRCLTYYKIGYFRLDGQTKMADRQSMIDSFNTHSKEDVFLVSINSGSLGVNMIAANRVILVDLGWNPSHDEQAVARAYRYGQRKPVYVYRLHNYGTWEDKMYKNNIHKIGLAHRVIDQRNPDKHFTRKEISTYFTMPPSNVPTYLDEKTFEEEDRVLATVLSRHRDVIVDISTQASLWREMEEQLSEEEMAMAHKLIEQEGERVMEDGSKRTESSTINTPPAIVTETIEEIASTTTSSSTNNTTTLE
ncbi:P-loop containing nucleoside triphosphate hydrolase protein [Syncephalis fuscata]|nr:P-loop containing nucleoside triphosphate hydrolase protein [Syncephalis fuscata]